MTLLWVFVYVQYKTIMPPAQTFGHMFAADLQLESRIQSTNWKYPDDDQEYL